MNERESDNLMTRYLDDVISDEEMRSLNQLLKDSEEARAQFLAITEQAEAIGQRLKFGETIPHKLISFPRQKIWAACATVTIALIATFYFLKPTAGDATTIDQHAALIMNSTGKTQTSSSREIQIGETVETIGVNSSLDFKYDDGTSVHLGSNTLATITGHEQKRLIVHRGAASLDVKAQDPDSPMVLLTPSAELTVKGTTFSVFSAGGGTQLEVAEGEVEFTKLATGESLEIEAGNYSVTTLDNAPLQAQAIPEIPTSWSLDLTNNPQSKLDQGTSVLDQLGNVMGAAGEPLKDGVAECVGSHNAWQRGDYAHFRVEEGSVLKVRLKMEKPDWLNFIIVYRSPEVGSTETAVCFYDHQRRQSLPANEWVTIEFPLMTPQSTHEYSGNSETFPRGWLGFLVGISADDRKRGLVVERIWTE